MAPKTHELVAHNATHYRVRIEVELECAHEPTPEELIRLTRIARGALDREAYHVQEWSADVIRRPGGRRIDSMPMHCSDTGAAHEAEYAEVMKAARELLAHNERLNEAFFVLGKPKEVRSIMMEQKDLMRRLRAALGAIVNGQEE